jgi:chemotaxis response regulator CheB
MVGRTARGEMLSPKKQVVVLGSERLLTAGVASLLLKVHDIEVTQTTFAELEGIDALASMHPDVVILEETMIATHLPQFMGFIKDYPSVRLIIIDADSNELRVIDRQIVQIKHVNDFFGLLQELPVKDQPGAR